MEAGGMAQHGYLREYEEESDRGGERDWREASERNRSVMFGGSERERALRNFRSSQDVHYRAWRDRQIEALDRDYAEYCREREQEFHQDFDAWRRRRHQRHGNTEPLQTGMTQSGLSADPSSTLELTTESAIDPELGPDPMATATLGTSSGGGRGQV
jgi:hypothetical protein